MCSATRFDDLKKVSGEISSTFREACHRRGLLENDNQYSLALEEAVMSEMPSQVRTLYAIILTTCEPTDLLALWATHCDSMTVHVGVRACCSPASRHSSESKILADRLWSIGERDSQCQNTAVTDHRAAENCGDRSHSCRD